MINTLQCGRAIAALAVVAHHSYLGTEGFVEELPRWAGSTFDLGYLGVDFFFVLSGFIIYYTNIDKEKNKKNGIRFYINRSTRIFVPYLPISVSLIILYLLLPEMTAANRDWGWLSSLTLVPDGKSPALSVAWTLQYEMIFYLFFAIAFYINKLKEGIIIWITAIIFFNIMVPNQIYILEFLTREIIIEFFLGVACAAYFPLVGRRYLWVCLLLSALCFGAFLASGATSDLRLLCGVGFAFLVVPLVRFELEGKIVIATWLVFLGNASYSIYLIHNPLISVTSRIAAHTTWMDSWVPAMLFSLASSVLLGCIYHLAFERPVLAASRNFVSWPRPRPT